MASELFYVGFYSASEPGVVHRWRPKTNSPENVSRTKATERFELLVLRMRSGLKVDGLPVASVAIFTAMGHAIRSQTADGTEAQPMPEDAGAFLQTAVVRGQA